MADLYRCLASEKYEMLVKLYFEGTLEPNISTSLYGKRYINYHLRD